MAAFLLRHVQDILDSRNLIGLGPFLAYPSPDFRDNFYVIYYTETGRAGGAYLQDTDGDGLLDWVPVNDPRVFEEGRNVRMGLSVTF